MSLIMGFYFYSHVFWRAADRFQRHCRRRTKRWYRNRRHHRLQSSVFWCTDWKCVRLRERTGSVRLRRGKRDGRGVGLVRCRCRCSSASRWYGWVKQHLFLTDAWSNTYAHCTQSRIGWSRTASSIGIWSLRPNVRVKSYKTVNVR